MAERNEVRPGEQGDESDAGRDEEAVAAGERRDR